MYHISGLWPLYAALYALAFALGAALASFGGVVVHRLPRGEDFVRGRSRCDTCGAALGPLELIPVAGWLLLRGRCRRCGAPVSMRHPINEALGGGLAVLALWRFGLGWRAVGAAALLLVLHTIARIDWATLEIPDGLQLALCAPALLLAVTAGDGWAGHVIGLLAVSLPLLALVWAIPHSFGGGDIKLMAICGGALGWQLILTALFFALLTGGGYGGYLLLSGRAKRGAHMPFGPFLALGVAAALLFGDRALAWYLGFF